MSDTTSFILDSGEIGVGLTFYEIFITSRKHDWSKKDVGFDFLRINATSQFARLSKLEVGLD